MATSKNLFRGQATVIDVTDGTDGAAGAVMRPCGEWTSGASYVCDASYIDVVLYGGAWYACRKSHTASDGTEKSGTTIIAANYPGSTVDKMNGDWEKSNNLSFVATDLLLANSAYVSNLGVGELHTSTAKGTPRVEISGSTFEIYGTESTPNIRVYLDEQGVAHLQFLRGGTVLYDLGPDGIKQQTDTVPEGFTGTVGTKYRATPTFATMGTAAGSDTIYLYRAAYSVSLTGVRTYKDETLGAADGKYFTAATQDDVRAGHYYAGYFGQNDITEWGHHTQYGTIYRRTVLHFTNGVQDGLYTCYYSATSWHTKDGTPALVSPLA